ncbi:MAG: DUF504 domain-containing protein [Gammaproteobacteria bacterium]|nr:DUF504 domain-containing protein [Gammaproteobacteria bacterium]
MCSGCCIYPPPCICFNQCSLEHFFFHYIDDEGTEHSVPFHRIKSVYKDGERIWHREH